MVQLRSMTTADIPSGMYLKHVAGWNQTEQDWRRFLAMEPEGCFVAEHDGKPVGTVTTCVFASVAWIAMVLVEPQLRGQGIGRLLMQYAIAFLDGRSIPTIRLDATEFGRPLYLTLGFLDEYSLIRFGGIPQISPESATTSAYHSQHFAAISRLDTLVTGAHRHKLLTGLFAEHTTVTSIEGTEDALAGYCTMRPGSHAWQIGPCIANTPAAGRHLLSNALARCAGQEIIIDVPAENAEAVHILRSCGLVEQRRFIRMYRGTRPIDDPANLWASSGPEKG